MSEIRIPDFWKTIERKLTIDPDGIKEIKEILSLLNYTTIQSLTKFTKPKEIKLIELEFIGRRKELSEKYPHLSEFTFGSGTASILRDIAVKVKNKFVNDSGESLDIDELSEKVLSDGKKICPDLSMHCISIEQFGSEIKCIVRCPKCGKGSSLSVYYTSSGFGFRLSNFIRHLGQSHANETQNTFSSHESSLNQLKTELNRQKLKSQRLQRKLVMKNRSTITMQKENMTTCLTTVNNAGEEYKNHFEIMAKKNEDLQLEINQLNAKIGKFNAQAKDEGFFSPNTSSINENWQQKTENLEKELEKVTAKLNEVSSDRRELLHSYLELKGKIRVACRLCPALKEVNAGEIQYEIKGRKLYVPKNGVSTEYKLDEIFDVNSKQEDIFAFVAPLIRSALDGYCVSLIAYGQTGSGKTHTINGSDGDYGVTPRAIDFIYRTLGEGTDETVSVNISVFELYNNKIFDLIEPSNEPIFKSGFIVNLTRVKAIGMDHAVSLWKKAIFNRRTSATIGNNISSRSHAITQIDLTFNNKKSTITFVDLAGSEKPHDSSPIAETQFINSSLSALGTVVMNLRKKLPAVDFSQNILTKILKTSLIGDAKTILFVNVSMLSKNIDATLSSLRFATSMNDLKLK